MFAQYWIIGKEAQCNLSRYLIVSNPNPSPRGSGYPNFNIRNITIPTVGTHFCMFTSTKVAFFTRLLFPFLLLLQQEDDLPIQPRDCSSKSPAPLHQVKRITRDSLSVYFAPCKFTLCHYLFPEITLSLSECLGIPNFFHSLVCDIFPIQKVSSWQVMCVLLTAVS